MALKLHRAFPGAIWLLVLTSCCVTETTQPPKACPVQLLSIEPSDSGKEDLRLKSEGLDYMNQLKSPLYFVPILGVYRSGKSFLLNRMMGKCSPYSDGFGVGHEQDTYTRGILICAEEVQDLGTVVWMDTEGLFSSDEAVGAYGPKIFSLCLLFGSTVLLNNHKVFSESFFKFFDDQQQVARVLKSGLAKEGLPSESLLPENLGVFWVLQQPVRYDGSSDAASRQLDQFLNIGQGEVRALVRKAFGHEAHAVPVATFDSRAWNQLNSLADDDLSGDYISATKQLRERVLQSLHQTKPRMASAAARLLKMYAELVQTSDFDVTKAKDVFEHNELSTLCEKFRQKVLEQSGKFPSKHLTNANVTAKSMLETDRMRVMQEFHLPESWSHQLDTCMTEQFAQMEQENFDMVSKVSKERISLIAEGGACYFQGNVADEIKKLQEEYGAGFGNSVRDSALKHAKDLQRIRLMECMKVRHLLWPLAPCFISPVCGYYWRNGYVSGSVQLLFNLIVVFGFYSLAQASGRLPVYLDIDTKLLQRYPALLSVVMYAPSWMRWDILGWLIGILGLLRSVWKIIARIWAQDAVVFELNDAAEDVKDKLDILFKRTEASFKDSITTAALDAADKIEAGEARRAAIALLKGLTAVRTWTEEDLVLSTVTIHLCHDTMHSLCEFLSEMTLPSTSHRPSEGTRSENRLVELVVEGDWNVLIAEMFKVLQELCHDDETSCDATSCNVSPISNIPTSEKKESWRKARSDADETDDLRPRNLEASLESPTSSAPSFSSHSRAFVGVDDSGMLSNSPGATSEEEGSMSAGFDVEPAHPSKGFLAFGGLCVVITALVCAYIFPAPGSSPARV
mmetsp:Transcript_14384/g.23518  ORF Transcript_14384/g.23518 Transcript_14384/m.23518 type:complete len:851 (-) Transcript_14384:93-2645(-)